MRGILFVPLHSNFVISLLFSSHAALGSRMIFVEDFEVIFILFVLLLK